MAGPCWRPLAPADGGGVVLRDVPFQQEHVLPADGYGALVDALGQGWATAGPDCGGSAQDQLRSWHEKREALASRFCHGL